MRQMTSTELNDFLTNSDSKIVKIDVREQHELAHGMIEGAMHIAMNDIPNHLNTLEQYKNDTIVLICRSGKRSDQVGQYLEQLGFADVINLNGGMNAWAVDVDSSMHVY